MLPPRMTEPFRLAILEAQRICPTSGVEPAHLYQAVARGTDVWALMLQGLGADPESAPPQRELGEVLVPWSEASRNAVTQSNIEAARRRHYGVMPGHLAYAAVCDESVREVLPDVETLKDALAGALDAISAILPPRNPNRAGPPPSPPGTVL